MAAYQRACKHMNDDHRESMLGYAWALAGRPHAMRAELMKADKDGFYLQIFAIAHGEVVHVPFTPPLTEDREVCAFSMPDFY